MLQKVIEIAQNAGAVIMEVYNAPEFSHLIEKKGDKSPLTLADKYSHHIIVKGLTQHFPDIPVLSEEGRHIPYAERSTWHRYWCIDPLDGTKEFIKRNGEFAVHIALIEGQQPVLGVVHLPVLQRTYFAERGSGSFVLENEIPRKLTCASFNYGDTALKIVASRSHLTPETEAFIAQFHQPQTISMGSSMKFMLIAEGHAHVYPRMGITMEWDTAAPQIIVEEAGGKVIDLITGESMVYNKLDLLNNWFLVEGRGT